MTIGIFGGCFNPPHKMHEYIAESLIQNKYLNKVIFVPTGDYYPKENLENADNRIQMLKLICDKKSYFEVSDYEICNKSYTYKTLKYFKQKYPNDKIYFITGTDNLKELHIWCNYIKILDEFNLIVIQRNQDDIEKLENIYKDYQNKITFVKLNNSEIASSKIRKEFSNNNVDVIKKYMNSNVLNYILKNDMYIFS